MSYTNEQLDTLMDAQAHLDEALIKAKKTGKRSDWNEAQAVIDAVRELGYEHEADVMRKTYLREQADFAEKKKEYTWEPIPEDTDHPILTPEESEAPLRLSRERDELTKHILEEGEANDIGRFEK